VDEIRAAALGNTGDIPRAKWSVAMTSSGKVHWMAFDRVKVWLAPQGIQSKLISLRNIKPIVPFSIALF
jgi:hypothetical protein